ncbi:MAG: hypothetical protein H8E40_06380 [Chloroflexi bacterium]|nr:hypothetical protein [Chloroflexota bacterium]
MKKIAISIPDDLDERLRNYVDMEFKGIKGALSIVGIKAIEKYLDENSHESE